MNKKQNIPQVVLLKYRNKKDRKPYLKRTDVNKAEHE